MMQAEARALETAGYHGMAGGGYPHMYQPFSNREAPPASFQIAFVPEKSLITKAEPKQGK